MQKLQLWCEDVTAWCDAFPSVWVNTTVLNELKTQLEAKIEVLLQYNDQWVGLLESMAAEGEPVAMQPLRALIDQAAAFAAQGEITLTAILDCWLRPMSPKQRQTLRLEVATLRTVVQTWLHDHAQSQLGAQPTPPA